MIQNYFPGRGGVNGAAAVSSRLHQSGTASSRAKTADKSGSTSPQEKTTTMLKNTLRKMTRFSIGAKKKDDDDNFVKPSLPDTTDKPRSRGTFLGKSRVPKSQSPGPSVSRSKSFKEPAAPGSSSSSRPGSGTVNSQYSGYSGNSLARNNVYTSSLRRTKIKHQQQSEEKTDNDSRATSKILNV